MKSEVAKHCDLLADNLKALKRPFWLENHLIKVVSAAAYAEKGKLVEVSELKESLKLLRKKQGIFSDFRSYNELVVGTKISFNNNQEEYVDDIIAAYKSMQKGKFFGSSYRALAATIIVDAGKSAEADEIAERTKAILDVMRSKHPFLTSDQDTCFAVLLAMSGKEMDLMMNELEEAYQILKKSFHFHDNAVYSLAQVITTFDGNVEDKCKKTVDIFTALKNAGVKYGKEYELASLGALIDIDLSLDELVSEVKETEKYLKSKSGFKGLQMSTRTRLMFASMVLASVYGKNDTSAETAAVQGTVATVIAQEAAMLMIMMAASSASVAAHSSSN